MSYGNGKEIPLSTGNSPSTASTTTAVTGVQGFGKYSAIEIIATLTGATGGPLDVYVQKSVDGVNWYDYVHFTQVLAVAPAVTYSYVPALNDNIVAIGSGTTPVLAAGSASGGHWYDWLRVVFVSGAGTSAGAAQNIRVLAVRTP